MIFEKKYKTKAKISCSYYYEQNCVYFKIEKFKNSVYNQPTTTSSLCVFLGTKYTIPFKVLNSSYCLNLYLFLLPDIYSF